MLQCMNISVEVLSDEDRPMVVKRARGTDIDRLRLEGERLRAASHPAPPLAGSTMGIEL